jgi:hypothetical protein
MSGRLNVEIGDRSTKQLISGKHVIAREFPVGPLFRFSTDHSPHTAVSCAGCSTELGWKYVRFFLYFCLLSLSSRFPPHSQAV